MVITRSFFLRKILNCGDHSFKILRGCSEGVKTETAERKKRLLSDQVKVTRSSRTQDFAHNLAGGWVLLRATTKELVIFDCGRLRLSNDYVLT